MYDCVIVGGGHNGLVCANYLAREGHKVIVLESRPLVGGACVTEELWPGYHVSTAAYVVSLLLPEIEKDLELRRYGYRVLLRNPSSFTPFEDGQYLLLGPDAEENHREIGKFSQRDAEAYPRYEELLTRVAEVLEPMLNQTPPELLALPKPWRSRGMFQKMRDLLHGWKLRSSLKRLGGDLSEAIELLTGPARPLLDRWFESDQLKATLATDAIIGAFQSISAPGTAYVLLHHVMGFAGGSRGVWGYVAGGMGALSTALARSAEAAGVEIRVDARVDEILIEDGRVRGVRLADDSLIESRCVASNLDAHQTFQRLIASDQLPSEFLAAVSRIDYSSASMKINLAVSELPDFTCLPGDGHHLRGAISISPNYDHLERAYDDAKYGNFSQKPFMDIILPSVLDPDMAPPGKHVMSCFVQYAPYDINGGWDDHKREAFGDAVVNAIAEYAPNIKDIILHRQVLTPADLESIFGLTEGNIFHGELTLQQLFSLRPAVKWADYSTPVKNYYQCGSGTHPGGGITGSPGEMAAKKILGIW